MRSPGQSSRGATLRTATTASTELRPCPHPVPRHWARTKPGTKTAFGSLSSQPEPSRKTAAIGHSSTGRAPVSKAGRWGFESLCPGDRGRSLGGTKRKASRLPFDQRTAMSQVQLGSMSCAFRTKGKRTGRGPEPSRKRLDPQGLGGGTSAFREGVKAVAGFLL